MCKKTTNPQKLPIPELEEQVKRFKKLSERYAKIAKEYEEDIARRKALPDEVK